MKKTRHMDYTVNICSDFDTIDKIVIEEGEIKIKSFRTVKKFVRDINMETYYIRDSKRKKVINQHPSFTFSDDPFNNYHIVCAADTNTKESNGMKISASTLMIGMRNKEILDEVQYSFVVYVILWDSTKVVKPENYSWAVMATKIKEIETKEKGIPKILMIVDSDLGNHECFNKRSLPVIDDFYLPSNFSIAYASADVGAEFSQNQLIKYCDKEAKLVLAEALNNIKNGKDIFE